MQKTPDEIKSGEQCIMEDGEVYGEGIVFALEDLNDE